MPYDPPDMGEVLFEECQRPDACQLARGAVSAPGGHILASLLHWLGKTDINEYMIRSDLNDKEGV